MRGIFAALRHETAGLPVRLVAVVAIIASAACGSDETTPNPTDPSNRNPLAVIFADPYTLRTGDTAVTVVILSAKVSDPDSDPLTVRWTVPGGTFVEGTSDTDRVARVSYTGSSAQTVTLVVDDGNGGTSSRQFVLELGTGLTRYEKNYVEALFLGSGEFVPQDGNLGCPSWNERWSGFPKGTTVRVIVSTTVDGNSLDGQDTQQMIQDGLADVPYASAGWLTTTYETTSDPDPMPGVDEVTSTDHPDPASTGCGEFGCIHHGWRDPGTFTVFVSGRAVQPEHLINSDGFVHDIVGHGVMGLCHIDQEMIGGNPVSLMPGGPGAANGAEADKLSAADIVATRAVYGSGLDVGAGRAEFLAADLINREGFSSASSPPGSSPGSK